MPTTLEPKDPDAIVDYTINWARHLDDDTITLSSFAILEADPDLVIEEDTNTTTSATVWLSGGANGQRYSLTNTIETAGGRTLEQTIKIRVKER